MSKPLILKTGRPPRDPDRCTIAANSLPREPVYPLTRAHEVGVRRQLCLGPRSVPSLLAVIGAGSPTEREDGCVVSARVEFKYRAFLSYAHAMRNGRSGCMPARDVPHRQGPRGRETPHGPIPKTLRPIFRDRDEFTGGHSLTTRPSPRWMLPPHSSCCALAISSKRTHNVHRSKNRKTIR